MGGKKGRFELKKCTVSGLKRQFDRWHLFRAPTCICVKCQERGWGGVEKADQTVRRWGRGQESATATTPKRNKKHSVCLSCVATLRAWYRAQKPQNPENTKKNTKSPTQGWPPKIRKKNTKKIRRWAKNGIFWPFLYFFGIFFGFSAGQPWVGDFVFFHIFRVLGFLGSVAGPQGRNSCENVLLGGGGQAKGH